MDVSSSPSPSAGPAWLPNPFAADVCTTPFEVAESRSVTDMNRDVFQRVANAIEDLGEGDGHGRSGKPLLLLTAPRAGYGKTHLLGRMAAAAEAQAVAMPLIFRPDADVTWPVVGHEAVEVLRHLPSRTPGWARLREICAGVFASMVLRLIRDGRLPCANPQQAMRVLSSEPADLFRENTSAKMIGDWLKKHYGQLRKPLTELALALPDATGMEAWVDALFAGAHHGSATALEAVVGMASGSRRTFELWLRLVTLWRPVVLFVDHLDGFYRQENCGLRIATMLLELAELENVNVVLSLNQDVWQATFAHHLPSALEDRLTASQFLLRGLSPADAADLVRLRLRDGRVPAAEAGQFEQFLDVPRYFQGRPVGSVSARVFLRHCALQWESFQQIKIRGHEPPVPLAEDDGPQAPLLPEEGDLNGFSLLGSEALPESLIFAQEDASRVQTLAGGLHEPQPAMLNTPFALASAPPLPPSPEPPPVMAAPAVESPFQPVESPFIIAPPPGPHPDWNGNGSAGQGGVESQPRAPGALEKLRDMMDRLRSQPAPGTVPPVVFDPAAFVEEEKTAEAAPENPPHTQDDMLARFEVLRNEMAKEAQHRPLDVAKLGELIRLAGKRFPLVKLEEVELSHITGRTVPAWNLQGMRILFGLSDFHDLDYWRALAAHALQQAEELDRPGEGAPATQLKLVALKSDRETLAWTMLQGSDAIPAALRPRMEVLHLDTRSIASLYAMQRMITEAEAGAFNATPSQVMSVLARELDFFWKRVTRPLSAVG